MASLPQMSTTLGACMSSNKTINPRPCIAQLNNNNNNKRSTPFSNLIANHQIVNGTLFPFALVGQKKPIIELWKQCQNEKWKARAGKNPEFLPHSDVESVVKEFYDAFNKKDIEKLKQLVSDDCEYQDYLFYNPYKGKEQIIEFWQEVMDALGPNIKIAVGKGDIRVEEDVRVEDVKESKPMATVKVTGLEELPLKPGEIVLRCLTLLPFETIDSTHGTGKSMTCFKRVKICCYKVKNMNLSHLNNRIQRFVVDVENSRWFSECSPYKMKRIICLQKFKNKSELHFDDSSLTSH
ncbi:hypothetical protein HKD37_04G011691 [Glycine soja]